MMIRGEAGRDMELVAVEREEKMVKAMVKKKNEMVEDKRKKGGRAHTGEVFFLNENGKVFLYSHIIY